MAAVAASEVTRLRGELDSAKAEAAARSDAAKRWRARCPVTAEDVERAGVTAAQAHAWGQRNGHKHTFDEAWGYDPDETDDLADDITAVARAAGRVPLDILDEMAAEVTP